VEDNWRSDVMIWAHLVPPIVLLVEFSMNRVKLNLKHARTSFAILVIYLTITVFYELVTHMPAYQDNLVWFCKQNKSYKYKEYANEGL
jgi:hypothetical protein